MNTQAAIFTIFWFIVCTIFAQPVLASRVNKTSKNQMYLQCCEALWDNHPGDTPYVIIGEIEFEGNEATRNHILLRELPFNQGDTLMREELAEVLERSRENLMNTSLFNFVNVSLLLHDMLPLANVKFTFVERWYIWPFPIFEIAERNLSDWIMSPSLHRTNYGAFIVKENFRGRMERLSVLARAGYRQIYSFNYSIPYINKKNNLGLNLSLGYTRRNEIDFLTLNNTQLFYSEKGSWALQQLFVSTGLRYRRNIHQHHFLSVEFNNYQFADSLLILNPQFSPNNETRMPFFSLGYDFKNDHRDFRAYPLRGHYFDIRIKRRGLGILKNEKMDITQLESSVRKFWELDNKWYFAAGLNAKTSAGNFQPYFLQQGLGFKGDIVRGYENFVIDGQHFAVLKTNLKYNLLPSTVRRIGFIGNEKFSLIHYALYVNFFTDMGYVQDNLFFKGNPYSNTWLLGSGIGIDLVTYYDKVFRTEFSFTRQGDFGLQLHLIAPI
jgi:outer membrane protein assembly factor BamA